MVENPRPHHFPEWSADGAHTARKGITNVNRFFWPPGFHPWNAHPVLLAFLVLLTIILYWWMFKIMAWAGCLLFLILAALVFLLAGFIWWPVEAWRSRCEQ